MNVEQEFKALLEDTLNEMGTSLQADLADLSRYASERSAHLSELVGQPGFEYAVRAERDSVALHAGITTTNEADATDQRLIGLIQGALRIGATALAAAV